MVLASPASSLVTGVRVVLVVGLPLAGGGVTSESYCSIRSLTPPSRPKFSRQKTLWLWLAA